MRKPLEIKRTARACIVALSVGVSASSTLQRGFSWEFGGGSGAPLIVCCTVAGNSRMRLPLPFPLQLPLRHTPGFLGLHNHSHLQHASPPSLAPQHLGGPIIAPLGNGVAAHLQAQQLEE